MLQQQFRIPKITHSQKPRIVQSHLLRVSVWKTTMPLSRFSVVVSKRIDTRAVVRNRLRRVMYEKIQRLLPDAQPGYDVRISLKKQTDTPELTDDLVLLLKKVALIS